MCKNSSMMDLDFLSTSSSDRAGLSGVWTGSGFTVDVKTLWKLDVSPTRLKTMSWYWGGTSVTNRISVAPLEILLYLNIFFHVWPVLCPSPDSLTLLRSGSVFSSAALGFRGSAPSRSRSLRGSSGVWLSSSSFELLPLTNDPGRDDGGPEISGFSLRSLPELLRLMGGKSNKQISRSELDRIRQANSQIYAPCFFYLPRVLLESKSVFCGGVLEGWDEGVDCSAE